MSIPDDSLFSLKFDLEIGNSHMLDDLKQMSISSLAMILRVVQSILPMLYRAAQPLFPMIASEYEYLESYMGLYKDIVSFLARLNLNFSQIFIGIIELIAL